MPVVGEVTQRFEIVRRRVICRLKGLVERKENGATPGVISCPYLMW